MNKRLLFSLPAPATMLLVSSAIWAGYSGFYPVTAYYDGSYGYGWGSLRDARDSTDGTQFISCYISTSGGTPTVTCSARDAYNNYASCYSYDSSMASAVAGINENSFIYFTVNSASQCSYLYVEHGSHL